MATENAQACISAKIREVMDKGVRGKKVSKDQAVAIALSHCRSKGFKIPKK